METKLKHRGEDLRKDLREHGQKAVLHVVSNQLPSKYETHALATDT